jgi:hypothetical protein
MLVYCFFLYLIIYFNQLLTTKKQNAMKVKISNPNPYQKKQTNPETGEIETLKLISYVVSGDESAVAQYRQDQLAERPDSVTADDGKPLIHFKSATAVKYGLGAELERTIINGKPVWFMDNEEDKQLKDMLAGASTVTQRVFAEQEIANLRLFAKELAANKKANLTKLLAKSAETKAPEGEGKGIDNFIP